MFLLFRQVVVAVAVSDITIACEPLIEVLFNVINPLQDAVCLEVRELSPVRILEILALSHHFVNDFPGVAVGKQGLAVSAFPIDLVHELKGLERFVPDN